MQCLIIHICNPYLCLKLLAVLFDAMSDHTYLQSISLPKAVGGFAMSDHTYLQSISLPKAVGGFI